VKEDYDPLSLFTSHDLNNVPGYYSTAPIDHNLPASEAVPLYITKHRHKNKLLEGC
jgi:hypothetical protein